MNGKKILIVFAVVFAIQNCHSQSFEVHFSNSLSINTCSGFELLSKNVLILEPSLGFNAKNHSVKAGLVFPVFLQNENRDVIESPNGVAIGYNYYFASTRNDVFRFFATYNLSYYRLKYNSNSSGFYSKWHVYQMFNQFGAGIKYKIKSGLFFTTDLLFGFTSYKNKPIHVSIGDPLFYSMSNYKHKKICYFRIGISYDLSMRDK